MGKRQLIVKMAVGILSTLLALVLAEFFLRAASKNLLHLFDVEMWRYAREVKRESPLPGFVEDHRPGAEATLMGVRIRTDSSGFRRPDPPLEALRQPSNHVVVALGDSLTLGWGVPEGQTYADVLEKTLNKNRPQCQVSVLNGGIGNSNTAMELARYERNIRPLHPDWLILGFFINDAEPDPKPEQSVFVRNSALVNLVAVRLFSHLEGSHQNYEAYYRELYEDNKSGWIGFQTALAQLGRDLQTDNVRATILLLPEMHEPRNFGTFMVLK
jgi:lysophospholipase L1-like esterase